MRRHRQPLEVMASMNITNLLDTAFILLITFMLIVPELTHGIKINLPTPKEAPNLATPPENTMLISIQEREPEEPEERIYVDGNRMALDDIFGLVRDAYQANPDLAVVIEEDKAASWGIGIQVLAEIKRAGIERVGIKTSAGKTPPPAQTPPAQ
jgi:biopolymer transport protein ExbD